MPELPEVETIRRGLEKRVVGLEISDLKIANPGSVHAAQNDISAFVIGAKIVAIRRRAKVLIVDLSTEYSLLFHLRMTGQLVFRADENAQRFDEKNFGGGHPTASFVGDLPDKTTRAEFDFLRKNGEISRLFFNDQRKFGYVKLVPSAQVSTQKFIAALGPEIVDFTEENPPKTIAKKVVREFISRARHHENAPIKAVILDQKVVAGIGNIYADEGLWGAKIHPAERVKNLDDAALETLLDAVRIAMTKSIAAGGSSMKNYVKSDGSRGDYLELFANVFRREGQPCPRCGAEIVKLKIAGRGTHICPKCQKLREKPGTKSGRNLREKSVEKSREAAR